MNRSFARVRQVHLVAVSLFAAEFFATGADSRSEQIARATEALRHKLSETRRDFHAHPELSNREERTSRIVAERLRALGFDEVKTGVARHGVVALLHGGLPGPAVAVRADLDALPITEANDTLYKSQTPGVMHACGHDAHTTIALGVAEVLTHLRGQIHGSVKFLFQPAEEGPPPGEEGGAPLMIKEGALDHPRPLAIFGLHTTPELEAGLIAYRAGPAQASLDLFIITIRGQVPDSATPHRGVDTIVVAAECVSALQTIKSRRIDTFEPVIVTVGTIHGGTRPFNTPEEVRLEGCVRTFNEDARDQIQQLMHATLAGVTSAYGAKYQLDYKRFTRVLVNDARLVEASLPALRRAVGQTNVVEAPKRMGGEDFSFYGQVVPAFFFRLGSGNKARGIVAESHTPKFDIDEKCLEVGVKAMVNVVLDFLERQPRAEQE